MFTISFEIFGKRYAVLKLRSKCNSRGNQSEIQDFSIGNILGQIPFHVSQKLSSFDKPITPHRHTNVRFSLFQTYDAAIHLPSQFASRYNHQPHSKIQTFSLKASSIDRMKIPPENSPQALSKQINSNKIKMAC